MSNRISTLDVLLMPEGKGVDIEDDADVDTPAGVNRRKLMDLLRLTKHHRHAPESWCAHQGRGKHQGCYMAEQLPGNVLKKQKTCPESKYSLVPIPITLDIDMRAKTLPMKHNSA
jgi:hypothetical protein